MTEKVNKRKNANSGLTIALISVVIISMVFMSGFSQSNSRLNTETVIQGLKQPGLSTNPISNNETNSLNTTNSYNNNSTSTLKTDPVSLNTLNSTTYEHPDMTGFFFLPADNTGQGQIARTTPNSNFLGSLTAAPISLDASKFATYTYGGYPVQQPDSSQFIFSFPDYISQGQIAGSDALAWNNYSIQKIEFDAAFIAPKINALGFDEMAIFATSDTCTYKGTEFGVRLDLKCGFIYGYIQEPNGNYGEVNFMMQGLMLNDGIRHHYALIMVGAGVSFLIDGMDYGYLNFPSGTNYSSFGFSVCAVVHRFTDGWDSSGDNMIAGNFSLNQQ